MTRYTKIGRKTHLEASDFQVQALIPRRKRQISNDSNSNNNEYTRKRTAGSAIDNHRDKRARQKKNNTICYSCRKTGHSVSECPNAKEQGVGYCYKCGSKDHTTKRCHIKADVYTFAQCFICNEKGHLASKCPQNDRGVYPNGGCCRFCGSICHLSKDCKPASANQDGEYTLGTIDMEQGGDDDDVFLALHRIQTEKKQQSSHSKSIGKSAKPITNNNSNSNSGTTSNTTTKPKKKVVVF